MPSQAPLKSLLSKGDVPNQATQPFGLEEGILNLPARPVAPMIRKFFQPLP